MASVTTLSQDSFDEELIAADEPVLVDFWAEWCGPCRMMSPVLEDIASERSGRLRVAKLNVDENVEVARRFQVLSIPTLILFQKGEPQLRLVGAKHKEQLLREIDAFL